jgi:hypothetical protein
MTDDKKTLADLPAGFRINDSGDVEMLTETDAPALIDRVVREAMQSGLAPRAKITRGK